MPVYTVHEAETQLSKLMERAERGEEVIVARGDKPAMRIAPVAPANKPKRQPGMLKGVIPEPPDSVFFDPRPEEELKPWEEDYKGDPLNQPADVKPHGHAAPANKPKREPGALAGQIIVHDSFYEPMTEEELREFEEGHPGDPLRLPLGGRSDEASS